MVWAAARDGRLIARCGAPDDPLAWLARYESLGAADEALHPADRRPVRSGFVRAARRAERASVHCRLKHGTGWRWAHLRVQAERDGRGRVSRWVGSIEDVHEQQEAQAAMRAASQWLDVSLDRSDCWAWDLDVPSGRFAYTDRWEAVLGYAADDLDHDTSDFARLVHPDDQAATSRALRSHLAGHAPFYQAEYRVRTSSGGWIWVLDRGRAIERGADGRALRAVGTRTVITERKEAELAAARTADLFRLAQRAAGAGVWEIDVERRAVVLSSEGLALHGLPVDGPGAVDWDDYLEIVHPDDRADVVEELGRAIERRSEQHTEYRIRLPDGRVRWLQALGMARGDGPAEKLVGLHLDATERKLAEIERRASEARRDSILENLIEGVVAHDPVEGRGLFNAAFARMFFEGGAPPFATLDEALAAYDLLDASGRPLPVEERPMWRVLRGEKIEGLEARARLRSSGREIDVVYNGQPVRDGEGQVTMGVLTVRDVTEARRAEAALDDARARLEAVFNSGVAGMMIFDVRTRATLAVNDRMLAMSGLTRLEATTDPKAWARVTCADHIHLDFQALAEADEAGCFSPYEKAYVGADGRQLWVRLYSAPLPGHPMQIAICAEDITARKAATEALAASEERLRLATEGAGTGTWDFDLRSGRGILSPSARRLLVIGEADGGFRFDEWAAVVHPDDLERALDLAAASRVDGKPYENQLRLILPGGVRWMHSFGTHLFDDDGAAIRHVGAFFDISARKADEEQLRRLQNELAHVSRVSSMGELAASIAHELNQPLTATSNFVQAALRILANPEPDLELASEALRASRDQTLRAGEIIRRLRRFIAKGELSREPIDLSALIAEACALLRSTHEGSGASVIVEDGAGVDQIVGDRVQLQQVLFNLLRNAAEASRDANAPIRITTGLTEEGIELSVVDRGPGIPDEVMAKLFEPFVTTKPDGMGIGLSICRTIVRAHGGELSARNRAQGGAVFTLTLPCPLTVEAELEAEV